MSTIHSFLSPSTLSHPFPIPHFTPPCKPITSKHFYYTKRSNLGLFFTCRTTIVLCKSLNHENNSSPDDYITRILKQNPSQVEPRFRIGDRLYTCSEREILKNQRFSFDGFDLFKRENLKGRDDEAVNEEKKDVKFEGNVYLKDLLREYRGKLYVPEQVFRAKLSEEDEFYRDFETLPKLSYEEFVKFMKNDQVKMLVLKEQRIPILGNGVRDFIVELKETRGDKSLHQTKWAMRLTTYQAEVVLDEYKGPQYEIETRMSSWVAKLPEYPNPVASSISSRIMVELGMVAVIMAAATAAVGGFFASAVFAATSFAFLTAVYIVWPLVRPFLKLFLGILFGLGENIWEYVVDMFADGGIFYTISEFNVYGGVSSSLGLMKPILFVLFTMVILFRFTISRRPKDFRKWDIWQGIEFSQSKSQARVDGATGVTFSDVAGIDEAVEELQELVNYLKNPELFDKLGIKPPHGVLLEGPPGCGKTLVAKAIAGEAGVPFYQMAGSEFVEVLVGVGSARIRDLFKRAKVNKPSVIFIDEIDALATKREGIFNEKTDEVYNAGTQERETTLNQLLIELDGFDTGKGVIFIGATNRRDLLDPALLRPGRFDRKIKVRPPNAKGRLGILKVHARKVKLSPSVDLSNYANNLPGWTGAKLAQLLQEAALVAARKGHQEVQPSDIDNAVDRLTVGPIRVGFEFGKQGQCRRATSEIGTAITSLLLIRLENAKVERCDRVSINPRAQTASQVVFQRFEEELYMYERKPQLLHRLQVFLGGRAAEEVIYGDDTSIVSVKHLGDATWLARKIITIWNLENPMVIHGESAPWWKNAEFVGPRLDFEGSLYDDYGLTDVSLNLDLDDEIAMRTEKLLKKMYDKTVSLLRQHHAALLKTVKVLLKQKEISGVEIDYILDRYPAETPVTLVMEEDNPGSLPLLSEDQGQTVLEHAAMGTTPSDELV